MVYVFLAEGFEEIEGLTVVDILRRAEINTTMVSMSQDIMVKGGHGIMVKADALFDELSFADASMYVLPGGLGGANRLMAHEGFDQLLQEAKSKSVMLAAICAAPSVLGEKGLLIGKRATCYPGFEDKLLGAIFEHEKCVKDQDTITSRGMGTSIEFALSIVEVFRGRETRDRIQSAIQYE